MACTEETKEGDHGFFENFDYYNKTAESAGKKTNVEINLELDECPFDEEMGCYYFLINDISPKIQSAHIICEQFKKIYNLLSNSTIGKKAGELENNDYSFMNYWINDKLRGTNTDLPLCVKDFYKKLKDINENYFKITTLDDKLYNIKRNDLDNMRNLYDLYNIKDKIIAAMTEEMSTGKNASCLEYVKESHKKYKEAIVNCSDDCSHFHNLIKKFKKIYKDELSPLVIHSISCKSEELFELPKYGVVLKEHESVQIIRNRTLSVLLPLFGVFFMFKFSDKLKPFRQYIQEKLKNRKNMLFDEGERDNELFSYTSDDDSTFFNDEEYNISYYNVRNS
ncbi:PIR Superfamily Protein [Plasmodium ovale wallikeri]|uniref:PIR Superfamily Protein n=1 Tax=Plasmodium ovale wallikeri TaxID=864142 RepID=A0A1A9AHY5_PLAOA|nr:PIR Superfamily Protein [Plasmodium ovale wallikeri]